MFRRAIAVSIVALSALAFVPATAHAAARDFPVTPDAESQFVGLINQLRARVGVQPLLVDGQLTAKARGWSNNMAGAGRIFHSNLPDNISEDWHKLGENVGVGPSVDSLENAFEHSPEHYANLVDPGFRYVGLGVVNSNGTLYVTEEFMELASQPAPSTPSTATGTPSFSASNAAPHHAVAQAAAPAFTPPPPPPPPPAPSPKLTAVLAQLQTFDQ